MPILKASDRSLQEAKFRLEDNVEWEAPFFFIQGADTQLGLMYNFGTDGKVRMEPHIQILTGIKSWNSVNWQFRR